MVSILSCGQGAVDRASGRCQQPGKAVVVALGALAFVGGGAGLVFKKLPYQVSLGLVAGGSVGAIAAYFLWPQVEEIRDEAPPSELAQLMERLGLGTPEDLVLLELKAIRDRRADWTGMEGDLVRLIEGCPNLKEVKLAGFVEMFGGGPDFVNAHAVIRALVSSSVERVVAGTYDNYRMFLYPRGEYDSSYALADDALFYLPEVVRAALGAEAESQYLPLLPWFDGRWATDGEASTALALVETMPHLKWFVADDFAGDLQGLCRAVFGRLENYHVVLGRDLINRWHAGIVGQFDTGVSAEDQAYVRGSITIYAAEWKALDSGAKWEKMRELFPDRALGLVGMNPAWVTQKFYESIDPISHWWLDTVTIDSSVAELGEGMLSFLKTQEELELNNELQPRVLEQVAEVLGADDCEIEKVVVPEKVDKIPDALFDALRAKPPTGLVIENQSRAQLERLDGVTPKAVLLKDHRDQLLKGEAVELVVTTMQPATIFFDFGDRIPRVRGQIQKFTDKAKAWEALESNYDIEVAYEREGVTNELAESLRSWKVLHKYPLYLVHPIACTYGQRPALDAEDFRLYLKRKSS